MRNTKDAAQNNFAGSQAATWFGHLVEVIEPAWKTGIVYVIGPEITGEGFSPGYVVTSRVKPIGPVAKELLEMRR